jgi:diguanylate cyclase
MMTGDQVRTEVLYGMWLERLGQAAAGAERFANAARLAEIGLKLWRDSDGVLKLDEDFAADFHAALALADPGGVTGDHEEALRKVTPRIALPGQIVAVLALIRLLAASGRRAEADTALTELRASCQRFQVGMPLRLALARGVLDLPRAQEDSSSVVSYLTQIEDELWVMRTARTRALHARLEHERLRRGRSPMRALTARDPVTGLPDRTMLDELFGSMADLDQPVALAMVDVDDLVVINGRGSFADGDATLRAVAVTVRSALRPEDSVIRYSADDFVVLMPGRTLDDAAEAMRGAVTAVTELPRDRGHGATVSIGVVALDPDEGGESALVRADDATGEAKARGGNQVAAVPTTPAPR